MNGEAYWRVDGAVRVSICLGMHGSSRSQMNGVHISHFHWDSNLSAPGVIISLKSHRQLIFSIRAFYSETNGDICNRYW
jgi:hypothetical protein